MGRFAKIEKQDNVIEPIGVVWELSKFVQNIECIPQQ